MLLGPGRKQTRRFASKGEFRSGGKIFSTRSLYSLPQAGCPSSYHTMTDNQLLLSSVSGLVQKKRKKNINVNDTEKMATMRLRVKI